MDHAAVMNEMDDLEYRRAELMAFDWATSKILAEPVLKILELIIPNLNLDGGLRPYLLKLIQLGFEAGMESDDFVRISTRLRSIQALRAIVFLRFARRLHKDNIRDGGPGISRDFEEFVRKTESSILNRKLRFREISGPTITVFYHTRANTLILSRIKPKRSLLRRFSSVLHELYHSYGDSRRMKNSFWKNEKIAIARQIKARILLFNWLENRSGVQWTSRMENQILHRQSTHDNVVGRLGFNPDVAKQARNTTKTNGRLYAKAIEEFRIELDGFINPMAHEALQRYAKNYGHRRFLGKARSHGFKILATLHDQDLHNPLKLIANGALSDLTQRMDALLYDAPKSTTWDYNAHELLRDTALVRAALYFLGKKSGDMSKFHEVNSLYYKNTLPWLKKAIDGIPVKNDGI
jgi:hypothetical protein